MLIQHPLTALKLSDSNFFSADWTSKIMPEKDKQQEVSARAKSLMPELSSIQTGCKFHQNQKAFITCSDCGCGICKECAAKIKDPLFLVCPDCQKAKRQKASWQKSLNVLKMPIVWVLFCIIISGVAYAMGIGNPNLEQLAKNDSRWPWYLQRVGKLYLERAAREQKRAAFLKFTEKTQEAEKWYCRAANSFSKAADYWKSTPAYPDLKIAEALMLNKAGKSQEAFEVFKTLEQKNKLKNIQHIFYYHWGITAQKLSAPEAKIYLNRAIVSDDPFSMRDFEGFVDTMSKNRKEGEFVLKIKQICGTSESTTEINKKARKALGIKEEENIGFGTVKPIQLDEKPKAPKTEKSEFEVEFLE